MDDGKRFKLVTPSTDEDVFGGEVSSDNVYIKTYGARLPGEKLVEDLLPGEGSLHEYRMSGQKPTVYKIVRMR